MLLYVLNKFSLLLCNLCMLLFILKRKRIWKHSVQILNINNSSVYMKGLRESRNLAQQVHRRCEANVCLCWSPYKKLLSESMDMKQSRSHHRAFNEESYSFIVGSTREKNMCWRCCQALWRWDIPTKRPKNQTCGCKGLCFLHSILLTLLCYPLVYISWIENHYYFPFWFVNIKWGVILCGNS